MTTPAAPRQDLSSPTRSAGEPLIIGIALLISVALLWIAPPIGFVACAVMIVIAPPWGRTYAERAVISLVMLLGIAAIAFPRASDMPITPVSSHIAMTVFTIVVSGLRLVPPIAVRIAPLVRPRKTDIALLLFAGLTALWLMSAYLGQSAEAIVSGLFFTGWDNQGHFVPFANTIETGQSLWPTIDGSIAWNQWYPSLHTTVWALAELGSQWGAELPTRIELLFPYVQWTAISFALSLAALGWIATDLADRIATIGLGRMTRRGRLVRRYSPLTALAFFAAFALLGSPTVAFNFGFTNFMMGVAMTAAVAYGSARTWRTATRVGWFVLPIGAVAIVGLWTPLVLGVLPSAVVVFIAVWRVRRWLAPTWAIATAVLVLGSAYLQTSAIVEAGSGEATSFLEDLGAVGTGMSPFNIGVAIASPFIAVLLGALLWRIGHRATATAVAGSSIGIAVFAVIAMWGADGAELARLQSYYVLKTLNALLLVASPLLAAMAAVSVVALIRLGSREVQRRHGSIRRVDAWLAGILVTALSLTLFGYVGARPAQFAPGFSAAPGIEAAAQRAGGVENSLIGEAIVNATVASQPYPERTSMLWDGSGTLPNLWVASLRGVLSSEQQRFYRNLPPFPYDESTGESIRFALTVYPTLDFVLLWFRDVSGELMRDLVRENPGRLVEQQVPMRSSILCQECSG